MNKHIVFEHKVNNEHWLGHLAVDELDQEEQQWLLDHSTFEQEPLGTEVGVDDELVAPILVAVDLVLGLADGVDAVGGSIHQPVEYDAAVVVGHFDIGQDTR